MSRKQNLVFIVKPKFNRNNEIVTKNFKQNINPSDLQICLIQENLENGGVLVNFIYSEELNSIKSKLDGDDYEVKESNKLAPKVKNQTY